MTDTKNRISASISQSVTSMVSKEADHEKRSFSQMVEILLQEAIENRKRKGKK